MAGGVGKVDCVHCCFSQRSVISLRARETLEAPRPCEALYASSLLSDSPYKCQSEWKSTNKADGA